MMHFADTDCVEAAAAIFTAYTQADIVEGTTEIPLGGADARTRRLQALHTLLGLKIFAEVVVHDSRADVRLNVLWRRFFANSSRGRHLLDQLSQVATERNEADSRSLLNGAVALFNDWLERAARASYGE